MPQFEFIQSPGSHFSLTHCLSVKTDTINIQCKMSNMELDCFIKDLIVYKNGILLMKDKHEKAASYSFSRLQLCSRQCRSASRLPDSLLLRWVLFSNRWEGPLLPLNGTHRPNVCHYDCHNIAIMFQECTEQKLCSSPLSARGFGLILQKIQTLFSSEENI